MAMRSGCDPDSGASEAPPSNRNHSDDDDDDDGDSDDLRAVCFVRAIANSFDDDVVVE